MHCLRCDGLMIKVFMHEGSTADGVAGWRCLICGEAIDSGIEANRTGHCHPVRTRARVPGTPQQHPYVQKHETLLSSVCECFALQPDYSREITMTPEEQIVKMTTAIRQAIKVMADRFGSNEEDVAKAIRELKASLQTA